MRDQVKSSRQNVLIELKLVSSTLENERRRFSKDSPCCYLEFLTRVLYCLCIIPYYPKRDQKEGLTLVKIWIQQILCGFVHLLALLYQLQSIILTMQEDVMSAPLKVVPLAFAVSDSLYVLFWVYTFWRKQIFLRELILEMSTTSCYAEKRSWVLKLKCILFTLLPFVCFVFTLMHHGFADAPINSIIFINYYNSSSSENTLSNESNKTSLLVSYYNMAVNVCFIPWLFILQCVDALVLILAISSYEISSFYASTAENLFESAKRKSLASVKVFQTYILIARKLKLYFTSLNNFGSGFYFAWFVFIVPWLSFRSLETLMLDDFPYTFVYNWTFIFIYIVILGYCAESRRQCENFKEIVEESFNELNYTQDVPHDEKMVSTLKYVKYAINQCGVKGGRFFIFSYGLLGNTIGLIIAYSLLFIQFHNAK